MELLCLGTILLYTKHLQSAYAAFRQALQSRHPEAVPGALYGLGAVLCEQGDFVKAMAAFQQAKSSGHPQFSLAAAHSIAALLYMQGDLEGAHTVYEQANAGHTVAEAVKATRSAVPRLTYDDWLKIMVGQAE